MSDSDSTHSCAIRLPAHKTEQQKLEVALGSPAWAVAAKLLPKDDDELNAELCAGKFKQVVFADLDSLLEMMWKGEVDLDRWQSAGVHVDLVSPPSGPTNGWHEMARTVHRSYTRWRGEQRRRQIVAAVILSAVALLAMAALFLLIPPTR